MEASLIDVIRSLQPKIEKLASERDELARRLTASEALVGELRRARAESEAELEQKRQECEFLKMSHRLADSPDTLAETRRHISGLIRRLDASIRMIEDDPAL